MENKLRYTLGEKEKLKSRKTIEHLFNEGKSFSLFPFRVIYIFKENETLSGNPQISSVKSPLKTAFSVGKKYFKKATDRNRIKRLIKEAWRLQKNVLTDKMNSVRKTSSIFIIYTGNELPEYDKIFEKTGAVINRLIKICNEAIVTNI